MSSFKYYEGIVRHNPTGERTEFIEGVQGILAAYWRQKRAGKLPPLSDDDRDEALDRVMLLLTPTLRKYDAERGIPLPVFVANVMRYAWLRYAFQVWQEASALQTNVFDQDMPEDDERAAMMEAGEDAPEADALTYVSPPLGLGEPMHEAEILEHIEALEALQRGELRGRDYQRRMRTSKAHADSRKRLLTPRRRRRRQGAAAA